MLKLFGMLKWLCIILVLGFSSNSLADIFASEESIKETGNAIRVGNYLTINTLDIPDRLITPGTLTVNGGSQLEKFFFYVGSGYNALTDPQYGTSQIFDILGILNIDGPGSLIRGNEMFIGGSSSGVGVVNLTNGGKIQMENSSINLYERSKLNIEVTGDDMVVVGSPGIFGSSFSSWGTVTFTADEGLAAGAYKPINLYSPPRFWVGDGLYQAFGGVWDNTAHTFTVGAPVIGTAGEEVTFDLSESQRFFINDQVKAQFMAKEDQTNLTFIASTIDVNSKTSLEGLLNPGESILNGWSFDFEEGYTEGDPVYISLFTGAGYNPSELKIWHFDDESLLWSPYETSDLTYDGLYANFNVNSFSGYAVTGPGSNDTPVPVPATIFLLGTGLAGLAGFRKKFFKK